MLTYLTFRATLLSGAWILVLFAALKELSGTGGTGVSRSFQAQKTAAKFLKVDFPGKSI